MGDLVLVPCCISLMAGDGCGAGRHPGKEAFNICLTFCLAVFWQYQADCKAWGGGGRDRGRRDFFGPIDAVRIGLVFELNLYGKAQGAEARSPWGCCTAGLASIRCGKFDNYARSPSAGLVPDREAAVPPYLWQI